MPKTYNSNNEILRKYIRASLLLNEDSFSGTDSFGYAGAIDPLGGHSMSADPGPLIKTFITPFTDVFKTVVASTKAVTTDAATLINVAFQATLSTIIPICGARYDKIFVERDKKIAKIESDYSEVFDRTRDAFDGDAKLLAFMASPASFLAGAAALKAPAATKEVLSVATGGYSDAAFDGAASGWARWQEKILSGGKSSSLKREREDVDNEFMSLLSSRLKQKSRSKSTSRDESLGRLNRSILFEEEDLKKQSKDKKFAAFLKDMLSRPKIVDALSKVIKNNSNLQDLKSKLTKVEDETLRSADDLAQNIVGGTNTFEDIEKLVANNPDAKESLKKIKSIKDPKQKDQAAIMLAKNIKAASKQTFIATLSKRMNLFPKDTELNLKYQEALKKLKSL